MIIIFLALSSLRTLQGAPIPAATSIITDSLVARVDCSTASNNTSTTTRTTYELVRSCLLTIFACVWKSVHPNIPGPRDSGWSRLKRRLTIATCALIAPELMAMWALRQYLAAKNIADDYNKIEMVKNDEAENTSIWCSIKEWFSPQLPEERAKRRIGQQWTITHGFFIQMGGFLLYEDDKPTKVLKYDDMKQLIVDDKIDAPIYTETDLQDRSKGDIVSKGLVALQTTWFVMQCITRLCSHLPLSELEVVTLGFAVLNGIIYGIWWKKPQGVGAAIFIPLKKIKSTAGVIVDSEDSSSKEMAKECELNLEEKAPIDGTPGGVAKADTPTLTLEIALADVPHKSMEAGAGALELEGEDAPAIAVSEWLDTGYTKKSWLRQTLGKAREAHHWLLFTFVFAPYLCVLALLRPLIKMGGDLAGTKEVPVRIPVFYADKRKPGPFASNATCGIAVLFGLVHLFGWSSESLSPTQRLLWRISTLVIIAVPVVLAITLTLLSRISRSDHSHQTVALVASLITAAAYLPARLTLITLVFISLHLRPPKVLETISWTSFIPHV